MKCPICDKSMVHSRLRGYYCHNESCNRERHRLRTQLEQGQITIEEYEALLEDKRNRRK